MKTTVFRPSSSPMRWPAVFALLLLAVSHLAKAQAPPGCSAAQFQADSCQSQLDGVCDAGTTCNLGTDCFDCDPCHSLRYQGCEACTAAGCQWCGRDAVCFSPSTLQLPRSLTCSASDFVDTCTAPNATTNEFSDPFYDAASWLFDLINIKEVWQSGISKSEYESASFSASCQSEN